ncbi:MAG: sarcosine oxidase subunit delta [Acidimicrobiales bacterium]|nr:sarcosine oxidase subunit delta [Acidimicrobiales bacterium]
MLLVPCPNCGPRNAADLTYRGESHPRPDPGTATKHEWRTYLYLRDNPSGWLRESWYCSSGCRTHFQIERHTLTGEIRTPPLPGSKTAGGT